MAVQGLVSELNDPICTYAFKTQLHYIYSRYCITSCSTAPKHNCETMCDGPKRFCRHSAILLLNTCRQHIIINYATPYTYKYLPYSA